MSAANDSVAPKIASCNAICPADSSTNCGRKTIKNNNAFGLSKLFTIAILKIRIIDVWPGAEMTATPGERIAFIASHTRYMAPR